VKVVNPDGQQDILQGGFQVKAIVNPSTFGADGQTFTPGPNGTTTIRTGLNRPVTISTPVDCDGKKVVSATVSHGGQAVPMSPAGGGIWTATILAKTNGPVTVSVVCEDGKTASKTVGGIELIDPSGYIYDAQTGDEQTGQRVPGATVTLYHKHPTLGDIVWDAKQFDQVNPQTTNGEGRYGWDVPAGDYFITIRHICYEDKQSQVVTVPPPVLDLNVGLQPKSKPCSIVYLPVILNNN
jgi:hypothetical protein